MGRSSLEQGFQGLAGQCNKFKWNLEKTLEVAGKDCVKIGFVLNLLTLRGIPGGSSLPALSSGRAECFGLCPTQKAGGRVVLAI